jgi:hypothetical protein
MKFKKPLEQYLYRWFREKKEVSSDIPQLGGVIIQVDNNSQFSKLKFIQTSHKGTEFLRWRTHEKDGKPRDNWLEEYTPSDHEMRKALKTVFILSSKDGTLE